MKRLRAAFVPCALLLCLGLLVRPTPTTGSPNHASPTSDHLIVHEWGTFTVLQDENGSPVGGINTDDEPLPAFVHNLNSALNGPSSPLPPVYFKGVPRNHPDVYTRLETPVIYFYPPGGRAMNVDVDVRFPAGWLTQFYPADRPALLVLEHGKGSPLVDDQPAR